MKLIQIVLYYVQDSSLLRVDTPVSENYRDNMLRKILAFSPDLLAVFTSTQDTCFVSSSFEGVRREPWTSKVHGIKLSRVAFAANKSKFSSAEVWEAPLPWVEFPCNFPSRGEKASRKNWECLHFRIMLDLSIKRFSQQNSCTAVNRCRN